jgi:hypothetical protein
MDNWPDEATVPSFGPRMRSSRCGKLGATAIPNWIDRADTLTGRRHVVAGACELGSLNAVRPRLPLLLVLRLYFGLAFHHLLVGLGDRRRCRGHLFLIAQNQLQRAERIQEAETPEMNG